MKKYFECAFTQNVHYTTLQGKERFSFVRLLLFKSLEDILDFLKYNRDYQFEGYVEVSILKKEDKYERN